MSRLIVLLLTGTVFAQTLSDPLLPRVSELALRFQGHLVDFSCTQITDRSRDEKHQDTIEESLSYLDDKVSVKLLRINGKPAGKLTSSQIGYDSTGVFNAALVPRHIFGPGFHARFERLREDTQGGAPVVVYSYSVNPFYKLKHGSKTVLGGFHGTFVADPATAMVLSRHQEMDTPEDPTYPRVFNDIEYGPVKLSDRELFLPVRIVETVRDGKHVIRNEARFVDCRKYSSDSSVTFEDPK